MNARIWREGDPSTEETRALDAVMAANEKLIGDAAVHAYRNNLAVLVMPRHLFERAARQTGRDVAAQLDKLALDTVVGPLPLNSCMAMVVWAGLRDPYDAMLHAERAAADATEPTVVIITVLELPAGPRAVASVVSLEFLGNATPTVDAVSTEKPRGDA